MSTSIPFIIRLFWALWFTIVSTTNVLDVLKVFGILPKEWKMASGNYEHILHTTSIYHLSNTVVIVLFLGVILWEMSCTYFFWLSLVHKNSITIAFVFSIGLFSSFILASEFFLDFNVVNTHIRLLLLLLVSFLAIKKSK